MTSLNGSLKFVLLNLFFEKIPLLHDLLYSINLSFHFLSLSFVDVWSQSYQTLIFTFFRILLLSLAILKHRQYFLMPQTLKLNKKQKKIFVLQRKSLVGLTPSVNFTNIPQEAFAIQSVFDIRGFD
jgi:hypothetical protein